MCYEADIAHPRTQKFGSNRVGKNAIQCSVSSQNVLCDVGVFENTKIFFQLDASLNALDKKAVASGADPAMTITIAGTELN